MHKTVKVHIGSALSLGQKLSPNSISLLFLRLPDVTYALDRVRARVVQGGHEIPEAEIRRRFDTGWRNFKSRYKDIADAWYVLDANNPSMVLLSGERSKHD
ncbi:MAG: hypothetical protein R6V42_07485 [Orrella sp.]